MKPEMTSKERLLVAMRNQQPDMVPATPDISNMIPCKLTGKPFWDIYLYENPPLWRAYLEAVKRYKIDGWFYYGTLGPSKADKRNFRKEIVSRTYDRIIVREFCETPEGELWQEITYYRDNPPTVTRKYIKDLRKDFKHLKYFFPDPYSMSDEPLREMMAAVGDLGIVGVYVGYPTLMYELRDGAENSFFDYYDNYDLVKEYAQMYEDWAVKMTERVIDAKPDFLFTGYSGTITLQSPEIFLSTHNPWDR